MQTASFYSFRPKTVRSPSQNRMFLVRKPYVFGTENVKGRLLETDVLFTFATYCASNTITNRTGFSIIFGGKVKGIKKPALHREPVSLCKEIIESVLVSTLFLNSSFLTGKFTQVVQFSTAYFTNFVYGNAVDSRRCCR